MDKACATPASRKSCQSAASTADWSPMVRPATNPAKAASCTWVSIRSRKCARQACGSRQAGKLRPTRRACPRRASDTEPEAPRFCSRNHRSASKVPGLRVPCGRFRRTGNTQRSPGRGSGTAAPINASTCPCTHHPSHTRSGKPVTGCPAKVRADSTRKMNCTPCGERRGSSSTVPVSSSGTASQACGSRSSSRACVRRPVLPWPSAAAAQNASSGTHQSPRAHPMP